jgi:hypothetical protein
MLGAQRARFTIGSHGIPTGRDTETGDGKEATSARPSVEDERAGRMGRKEIERMIAEALGETEEERPAPRRRVPHGDHILRQYVELCGKDSGPEPSGDVSLPAAPAKPEAEPADKKAIPSAVKRALARLKR